VAQQTGLLEVGLEGIVLLLLVKILVEEHLLKQELQFLPEPPIQLLWGLVELLAPMVATVLLLD
jgi:hypothetical protein